MSYSAKLSVIVVICSLGLQLRAAETPLVPPVEMVRVGWGKAMINRSIQGTPLTVGGKVYDKGLGIHPPGWIALELDGKASVFRCQAAIDDETKGEGTAELKFYGNNWRLLHSTGILRGRQPPVPVEINLRGETSLVIEMTVAGDGFGYDHIDLLNPVVVHDGAAPVYADQLPPGRDLAEELASTGEGNRLGMVIRELQLKFPAYAADGEKQLRELASLQE